MMKQKKQFMQHLLLMLVAFMSAASAKAAYYDFKAANSDGVTIYYKVNGDNATVVAGDEKYTGSVNIPETVANDRKEYLVTAIGSYAFCSCNSLTFVNILNTVTSIGEWAFYGCRGLEDVSLPAFITELPENVFRYSGLLSITIPTGVEIIAKSAFANCGNLASVDMPNTIEKIGVAAFIGCHSLEAIDLPNSLKAIGDFAFDDTGIKAIHSSVQSPFDMGKVFDDNTKEMVTLYIPGGTKGLYETANSWNFANIIEMEPEKLSQTNTLCFWL